MPLIRSFKQLVSIVLVFVTLSSNLMFFGQTAQAASFPLTQPPHFSARQAQTFDLPADLNKSFSPISITAGEISTLSVSIFNSNSFDLTLSSSPPAWIDILPSGMYFADPPNATTTCGGTVTTVGNELALIGGTVPAKVESTPGACTVTVHVTSKTPGNLINAIAAETLRATDPTGTLTISNPTQAEATLGVNSVQPPSLSKTFAPNTIWVSQTSTLTITLRNTDTATNLTHVSVTDNLPANLTVAAPPAESQCGGTVTSTATSITLSGGTVPKQVGSTPGTCTIVASITSVTPGIYTNIIPASAIQTQQGVTNTSTASAPLNVQSIGIRKAFSPSNFQVGGSSTLTITLENPTGSDFTGAAFTDNLPTGLTLLSAPASPQCGGTVTSTASSLTLADGVIPAGSPSSPGSCTITALVTSSTPATYTNTIPVGALTTDQLVSNIIAASANIGVYASGLGITGSKAFSPAIIAVGGTSTLTIRITAPADSSLTNFSISDALPAGVQVAAAPAVSKNSYCQGGTFAPAVGATLITYTGGTIPAGRECRLYVNVTSSSTGVFTNTISPANISNAENRTVGGNFSANLTVSGIAVSKSFSPDSVNVNGISTLTIVLTNTNASQLEDVSLSDTLPSAIQIAADPNESTTCPGGAVTSEAGEQTISLSSAVVPAQVAGVPGICTISVDVAGVGSANTYTNTIPIGGVTGKIAGTSVTVSSPQAASATLTIRTLTINVVKGFSPESVFGGSASTLTIQLSNPNNQALAGIAFTDNLPQLAAGKGMKVADPPNLSVGSCGGSFTASPGDTTFSYSGGYLEANTSCALTISVTMNVNSNLTNTIPAGAVTSTSGATSQQDTSASLTNQPGASVGKAFLTNPILPGGVSVLRITISNTGNIDLIEMGLTDELPEGLLIADTPAPSTTCGGTLTAVAGERQVQLANGALDGIENEGDPAVTCTIDVGVVAAAAGSYENCIPVNALTNTQNAQNQTPACDTIKVVSPPTIAKSFSPNPIAAGATSILTFTLGNPAANTVALTGVAFTDTFPAGLTVASVPNPSQCGGAVSSTTNSISLAGGTIPVSGTCTVTVSVTAATGGSYVNNSDAVTSTNGGTGNTASATLNVISPPQITKSFSPNPIAANGVTTLTFTITNPNADTTLTGVGFGDAFPTGMRVASSPNTNLSGCNTSSTPVFVPLSGDTEIFLSSASIAGGGVCTVSVDVTAPGGTYENVTAAVTSTNGGTGNTASDTLSVTGMGLSLEKTTSNASFQAGGIIDYTYTLKNTGDGILYAPFLVSDDHINGGEAFSCSVAASLAPGANLQCTNSYAVQSQDVTNRVVTNTATASAMDMETGGSLVVSNQDSVTVRLAGLILDKSTTTTSYRSVGNTITYNYTITNSGDVTLAGSGTGGVFLITDDHIGSPPGTPFACGTATSLAPGGNLTCSKTYTVTADDITHQSVTNTASAEALDAFGDIVLSNQDSVQVYLVIAPVISKAFSPNPAAVGTNATLTFTITNPSSNVIPLTGVAFSDTFPSGMTVALTPAAAQCGGTVSAPASNRITLANGTILPNSSCSVTVLVTTASAGSYVNTSGQVTSTNGGNGNTASATLNVVSPPLISKAFAPTMILVGETSTITFTITNPNASTPLTGVAFSDLLPEGLEVAETPNASLAGCSASSTPVFLPQAGDTSLSFSAGSIAGGGTCTIQVDLLATSQGLKNNTTDVVSSTEGGTGSVSNTATLNVDAPSLSLEKSISSGNPYSTLGGTIAYQYVLTNSGNVTLIGNGVGGLFTVSDDKVSVTCPVTPTGLAPGASITCTASYTVIQDDLDDGSVTNTATGHGLYGSTPIDSNEDSATATATQTPQLELTKTITSGDPYDKVNDTLAYTYLLRNSGNVTLTGAGDGNVFVVSDDKTSVDCPATPTSLAPGDTITCTSVYSITQADLDDGSVTNTATGHALFGSTTVDSNTDTQTADAVQDTGLILVKTIVSGNLYVQAGDVVEYSYHLTNSENVTLTGAGPGGLFTITDDHIGSPPGSAFTCGSLTSLAPGDSVSCRASYTITEADISAESVTNTASGHALFGATPIDSNEDTATADVKRGSIRGLVFHDKNLDRLANSGENGISGVTIKVYDSTGATLIATTTTGSDGRYQVTDLLPRTYIVIEQDPLKYVSSTPNTVTVTVTPGGSATADFGDYQITGANVNSIRGIVYEDLNNNGQRDEGEPPFHGVDITLFNRDGLTVSATQTASDGSYLFTNLSPGIYVVRETNLAGYLSTTLDQVSVVLGSQTNAVVDYGDLQSEATVVDPAVTKYGDPASARVGDTVVYTITVGNNGNVDALDVTLTDTKPAFLDIISILVSPDESFPINTTGNTFTIDFGTLAPGDIYMVTVVTKVNGLGRPPGGENTVSVQTSSLGDPIFNNNSALSLGIVQMETPQTGFSPGIVTQLPAMPEGLYGVNGGMWIEIPALAIDTSLVGIPMKGNSWDITWLGNRLGYLEGTAFPTWSGNSVITGHVYNSNGLPGPLIKLDTLRWGDQVIIHAFGQRYIYEVRSVEIVQPDDKTIYAHEDLPWVTLVTCKDYNVEKGTYERRSVVRSVLVKVEAE